MPDNKQEWVKYNATLPDGGPLYTETDFSHFVVEPWNAVSSLAFLIPAIYWFLILRKKYRENAFLIYCSVLLFIGGTGSTLYHAFRSSKVLITMDFLPMAIATLSLSIYFWYKVLNRWEWVAVIIIPSMLLRYFVFSKLGHHDYINASYFLTGVLIFLPWLFYLINNHWKGLILAIGGLLAFAFALFFRQIDAWHPPILSVGTHFLWHLLGALGCHFIALFVYKTSATDIVM